MTKHHFTYLALGDSYTIGESVPLHESFPYQAVQLLRKEGLHINAPEIVAKTGWTSNELAEHILHTQLSEEYDFVTLLIGVNNQYRGLPVTDFRNDLVYLVKKALYLSGGHDHRVLLLSIPDWGVTPFAADRDSKAISEAIDTFNDVCKEVAETFNVTYTDITAGTRKAAADHTLLAPDKLHYSGKEHAHWAEKVASFISNTVTHPEKEK